jgi:hypothetical protein
MFYTLLIIQPFYDLKRIIRIEVNKKAHCVWSLANRRLNSRSIRQQLHSKNGTVESPEINSQTLSRTNVPNYELVHSYTKTFQVKHNNFSSEGSLRLLMLLKKCHAINQIFEAF